MVSSAVTAQFTLIFTLGSGVQCLDSSVCTLFKNFGLPSIFKNGDIVLGGVFPIYNKEEQAEHSFQTEPADTQCVSFDLRAFRWTQAMVFAIEEINTDTSLLPNISLGYLIYDSCASPTKASKGAISVINGQAKAKNNFACPASVPVVIGESGSAQSIAISRMLGPFQIPMVSYFSTCACLSDKHEFPTFFRTVPSDFYQAKALAQLVKLFGWTWIGTIKGDNEYGRYGIQAFTEEVKKIGVCIPFSETVLRTYPRSKILQVVNTIKQSSVKVILAFASEGDLYPLMQEVVEQNITGIQWIASEAWITAARPSTERFFQSFGGTIGFVSRKMEIPEMKDFLLALKPAVNYNNDFIKGFWETIFECKLAMKGQDGTLYGTDGKICTGQERLDQVNNTFFDVTQLRVTYNVYKAVYAIANALHSSLFCDKGKELSYTFCGNISNLQPWQVYQHLKTIKFRNRFGENVYFDENGDPAAAYDIINWQLHRGVVQHVTVGYFDALLNEGNQLIINEEGIIWNGGKQVPVSMCTRSCLPGTRKATRKGQPICCFDCIQCEDGSFSNETDSTECKKCPEGYWSSAEKNKCKPKTVEFLSFGDAMGIILTAMALAGLGLTIATAAVFMYYKQTPIVKANNSELSALLLLSLFFCFLCPLTFIGEPSVWSCMLRHTVFGITFVVCISCMLGKTVMVVIAFKATLPNNNLAKFFGPSQQRLLVFVCTGVQIIICTLWLNVDPPVPAKNFKHNNEIIILECNTGSKVAFYAVLGYIGLLSCICFVLAFLARQLPDNFNEAKFITFSMLIFCTVWLTFIPAYISSPGKYTVAVEIFAILSSSFGLLLCIFFPKCYIILIKPEKNTKKHMLGKIPTRQI
ncbi:extracellular calcium-sensing receptor-like [Polypterus senegalus]|uniref:extracellular calcium-sensing receptor-like n=1 Tax=Polypterus senegalus TaxID=55291 RepID=UPI001965ACCE|nr:extracellular calcium-sensing receptor-like [Polypterus senegalus]